MLFLNFAGNKIWLIPHFLKNFHFFLFKYPFLLPTGSFITLKNHPTTFQCFVLKKVFELHSLIFSQTLFKQRLAFGIYANSLFSVWSGIYNNFSAHSLFIISTISTTRESYVMRRNKICSFSPSWYG